MVVAAAFFATGVRVFMPPEWGAPVSWFRTFAYNLAHFGIWAAITPLLWRLTTALPITRRSWRWSVPLQLVASLAIALGQLALAEVVLRPFLPAGDPVRPAFTDAIRFSFAINLQSAVMTYWAICGAFYAHAFHRNEVAASQLAAEARFRALESHVAPHFLFNSLNSVSALIDLDAGEAKTLVARIGGVLRESIASRDELTQTLGAQLAVVDGYLAIERVRFSDRLVIVIDASEDARRCEVPAFLLQPLVENAIRHGLQPSEEPVTIAVRARLDDAQLVLEVSDDADVPVPTASRTGFGLERTRARLAQCYGDAHTFAAGPRAGVPGFQVSIGLPTAMRSRVEAAA